MKCRTMQRYLLSVFELFLFSAVISSAQAVSRKNVLFLISDEHSGRIMGCAGDEIVKTPNFDALADSGAMFQSTYVQNPICVPSRASLATGRMPSKVGVFGNYAHKNDLLRNTPLSVAKKFVNAGYIAEWLGKDHWGTDNSGLGFGELNKDSRLVYQSRAGVYNKNYSTSSRLPQDAFWYGEELIPEKDTVVADVAISWLDEYDGSQPFFLGVSLLMPHFPFMIEQKYFEMYKDVIDIPRVTPEMIADLPSTNKKRRKKYKFADMTEEEIKKARAIYYGMISYTDYQMGRVINKLEEKGLREDTIIVYVSDHGDQAGQHGLWYKNSFYEDSVRVPMLLSHKQEIPAKSRFGSPVQLIDIMPTLFELCNMTIPKKFDGKTLMPLIRREENGWKRFAISETYNGRAGRMVRKKRWKYCWYEDGGNQLFNVRSDPAEEHNLINNTKYAKTIKNLHRIAMRGYIEKP